MALEQEIAMILAADATLTALLTGGIYTSGELGPLGITRDTVATAFDTDGWLLPCALVKEAPIVATGDVIDYDTQAWSARQRVEIWLYQEQGSYAAIDAARVEIRRLLQGRIFTGSFEARIAQEMTRLRDPGALAGASMARQDVQVDFVN